MKKAVSNWGNYPLVDSEIRAFRNSAELEGLVEGFNSCIARGNGRCYGDSSIADNIVSTLNFNKILSFDENSGIFECQAGATLDEILTVTVPRGWFLPVTPGTKFITVGGAVASNVHGKNHHAESSFCDHVLDLTILCGDQQTYSCSRETHNQLFEATVGGMGLTGVILTVRFQLKKIETAYIKQKVIKTRNLEETISLFDETSNYTYSVAWIDCLKTGKSMGRSLLMLGEHAKVDELPGKYKKKPFKTHSSPGIDIPIHFPSFVLSNYSIRIFNSLYYHKNLKRIQDSVIHYDPFFYPLDGILNWNRIYGKKGFLQYQFVLPIGETEGLKQLIEMITKNRMGSFLSVLKLFGEQDDLISFPMKGYTLAVDFKYSDKTLKFLDELDKIVLENGGRIYLTKDARMKSKTFWDSYPQADKFKAIVKKYNPSNKFGSIQSQRLDINP